MTYRKVIIIVTALTLLPMQARAQIPPKAKIDSLVHLVGATCASPEKVVELIGLLVKKKKFKESMIATGCISGSGLAIYKGLVKTIFIGELACEIHKFSVHKKSYYSCAMVQKQVDKPAPVEDTET